MIKDKGHEKKMWLHYCSVHIYDWIIELGKKCSVLTSLGLVRLKFPFVYILSFLFSSSYLSSCTFCYSNSSSFLSIKIKGKEAKR